MLCDICQTRQAKIFYTEIVNGQKKEQHLCEQCASEYTAVPLNGIMGGQGLSAVGSILSGILSNYAKDRGKSLNAEKKGEIVCPECGTGESEFLKTGRMGCPVCYNTFRDMIAKNFKTMQGGMVHTGKEPSYAKYIQIDDTPSAEIKNKSKDFLNLDEEDLGMDEEKASGKRTFSGKGNKKKGDGIEELKEKMKNAVAEEDYELAASIRDEIRKLENKEAEPEKEDATGKKPKVKSGKPKVSSDKKKTSVRKKTNKEGATDEEK